MKREDWLDCLIAYLEATRTRAFDPAIHNCATFVAGALEAMTDADPYKALGIAVPKSEQDVARILVQFNGVRGLCEAYFGYEALPPLLGARGDIAICKGVDGDTIGVIEDDRVLCVTPEGLWPTPLREAYGVWKVK